MSDTPTPETTADLRALVQHNDAATYRAGIYAMQVADKLAAGDVEAAQAALPPYLEASAEAERIGAQVAAAVGVEDA